MTPQGSHSYTQAHLCHGGFKTSPVENVYVEAVESCSFIDVWSLFFNIRNAFQDSTAYYCFFNPIYIFFWRKKKKKQIDSKILSSEFRLNPFDLKTVAPVQFGNGPYGKNPKSIFDLRKYNKVEIKSSLDSAHYAGIKTNKSDCLSVYTDWSKNGDRELSVTVFCDRAAALHLHHAAYIFTAKANAIILTL